MNLPARTGNSVTCIALTNELVAYDQISILPLYKVVKIHGSVGWKSIPFTLSERVENCLTTSNFIFNFYLYLLVT